jgi:exosortase A-associated hydrolase 1/exosortase A-associated hydrolase 2
MRLPTIESRRGSTVEQTAPSTGHTAMMAAAREHIRPFYLHGDRGPLLAIYYPPATKSHPVGDILLAPPFAEEMNRCRAMVAMQARAFSQIGVGTLVLDPYGTGDSAGEFSDGTWDSWRDDLTRGVAWLRSSANGCRALWGIRLGAVMAAELALRDSAISRLLLWQPVANGRNYFTQFLRIRIAAEMQIRGGIRTTEELRKRSAAGEIIEVSGYRVGPDLARRLDEVRLPGAADLPSLRLSWFEVLASAQTPHGNSSLIEDYRSGGVEVDYRPVVGPAFWQLHERTVVPDLIGATVSAVSVWDGSGAGVSSGQAGVSDRPPDILLPRAPWPEHPLICACAGDELMSIVHRGEQASRRGIVIVVAGGPQYRAGAHRQFVALARRLSARGYPVLRFDLRGMGDSSGSHLGYQHSAADIRAAIDALIADQPQVDEVVLFGECESASGILFYAYQDERVKGLALVNPWVRTEEGHAQALVKHYYVDRLLSRDFWRKVASGSYDPRESLGSLFANVRAYLRGRRLAAASEDASGRDEISDLPLPLKTAAGLRRFRGPVMILMSGRDYIAREFDVVTESSRAWRGLLDDPRVRRHDLMDADHTFSREVWKVQVADWITQWLGDW